MKQLRSYINIRKGKSIVKATDESIKKIVKEELDHLGHNADLNHIDVSKVTNMDSLFSCYDADLGTTYSDLNPDISKWNVGNVIDMRDMFAHCYKFNCDISEWDVSNVVDMICMFLYCEKFNQDLSQWDVSKVRKYGNIFENCYIKEEFKPKFK